MKEILDSIESPARKERLEKYRRVSKENRQRSGAMERRIAKQLRGIRVPYSGAGVMKADVFIRLPSDKSYIIECKSSSGLHVGMPAFHFDTGWVTRLDQNVQKMATWNTMFGAIVFHYHTHSHDFAAIDVHHLDHLPSLHALVGDAKIISRPQKRIRILYNEIFQETRNGKGILYHLEAIDRMLLVVDFNTFKEAANEHYFNAVGSKEVGGGEESTV